MKIKPLAICCAAVCAGQALAQNLVVFGDSLSDVGQTGWNSKAAYEDASGERYPLWDELAAQKLGTSLKASSAGGTDYAYSGGVAVGSNSAGTQVQPNLAVGTQVDNYLQDGVKKDALHVLWAGGNDMTAILTRAQAASTPQAQQAEVIQSAGAVAAATAAQWQKLQGKGVNLLVAPTVPNVVYTPVLFETFGEAAAEQLKAQAGGISGYILKSYFIRNFKKELAQLPASEQASLADFTAIRQKVLKDVAADLFADPLLKAGFDQKGITEEMLSGQLIAGYEKFADSASQAVNTVNGSVTQALNQQGGNVLRLDVNGLFTDILNDPKNFGFDNTVAAVCDTSLANAKNSCRPADQNAAAKKLFTDSFHPNTQAHRVMADYLFTTLKAPQEISGTAILAQEAGVRAQRYVRSEPENSGARRQPLGSVTALAAYNQGLGDDNGRTLFTGVKFPLTENLQGSAVFSYESDKASFGSTEVKAKTKSLTGTLRYDQDNFWIGGLAQVNDSEYTTRRNADLGGAHLVQTGSTGGSSLAAGVFSGYEWPVTESLRVQALGDLTYAKGKVTGFADDQNNALKLSYAKQNVTSLKSSLGAGVSLRAGDFSPYSSVRWVKEWKDVDPVTAGMAGSMFSTGSAWEADKNWVHADVGVSWQPAGTPIQAGLQVSHDFARKHASGTAVQFSFGARF